MNLLSCILEDLVQWTTVFANLATCLTAASAIFAVICFIKNRFTKDKFKAEIFLTATHLSNGNVKAIFFNLTFKNLTDKEVSVVSISIKHNGNECPVFKASTDLNDIRPKDLLTDLSISAYQSGTFEALFFGDKNIFSKTVPIELIVETTIRKFKYKKTIDFNTECTNT